MDFPMQAYTAIGAISAATIAGGISFISTVLAKEQKTSEFRQAWIDALRDNIAEEISLFITITSSVRGMVEDGKTREEINAYLFEKEDSFRKIEMVHARIMLRINPKEHARLLNLVLALEEYAKDSLLDRNKAQDLVNQLTKETQTVLKTEWKRVKSGETVFFATKWISLGIFIVSAFLAATYMLGHIHIEFM